MKINVQEDGGRTCIQRLTIEIVLLSDYDKDNGLGICLSEGVK